jgi:esterase/lipase
MNEAIEGIEAEIAAREAEVAGIRDGLASYFVWCDEHAGRRAPTSVLFLHGFSASPLELHPLPERVADSLDAHLYVPRFSGHGQSGAQLAATPAETWFDDARTAFEIAKTLGERVVLAGCSTGATLALWLAAEVAQDELAALVLLSPNFRPRNPASRLLTMPGGRHLARLLFGAERVSEPQSEDEAHVWTCRYPPAALVEMMRVVDRVRAIDLARVETPTFMIYSPEDQVVSPQLVPRRFDELGSAHKKILAYTESKHVNQHVLAGDWTSPTSTEPIVEEILRFIEEVPR